MNSTLTTWAEQIQAAAHAGHTLSVRGGGSKDFYGEPPRAHALLDTRPYRGIVSYEPSELVVTVRAGTPLTELEAALAEQGQSLAFEPPHFSERRLDPQDQPPHFSERRLDPQDQPPHSHTTVGGMVAAGLAGPARATAGGVRDHLLGVQMLNGAGERLTFGGQVMKNVAGYDVSRVMAGSMGVLGVITELSLKVLPMASAEATLQCHLPQHTALELLHRWGAQPLPLNASCWLHNPDPSADTLYVRLRGAVAAVQTACPRMLADVRSLGGSAQQMDNAQTMPDWQACANHTLPFFQNPSPELALWRLSLPATAAVLDLPYAPLVEWQGALRWLWAPPAAAGVIRAAAAQVGGQASVFRQAAAGPHVPCFAAMAPALLQVQQQLQKQLDPHGVFSTGRLGF